MNKDKKTLYIISFLTLVLLLGSLFVNFGNSKIVAVCILIPLSLANCFLIKRRHSLSINKKEVLLLSISGDYPDDADVDFKEIARVLRFLYPDSVGVRITIL